MHRALKSDVVIGNKAVASVVHSASFAVLSVLVIKNLQGIPKFHQLTTGLSLVLSNQTGVFSKWSFAV
jgi:hypothetical protein